MFSTIFYIFSVTSGRKYYNGFLASLFGLHYNKFVFALVEARSIWFVICNDSFSNVSIHSLISMMYIWFLKFNFFQILTQKNEWIRCKCGFETWGIYQWKIHLLIHTQRIFMSLTVFIYVFCIFSNVLCFTQLYVLVFIHQKDKFNWNNISLLCKIVRSVFIVSTLSITSKWVWVILI